MLVYVISRHGQPLMPTGRCGKVRRLFRDKKAKESDAVRLPYSFFTKQKQKTRPITPGIDAVFMGIMRRTFYSNLKVLYSDVRITFVYITKNTRIKHSLPKEHSADARCISGHPAEKPPGYVFFEKKICCHSRQIHKVAISGGYRKLNQAPYKVSGYRLRDKAVYRKEECFIQEDAAADIFSSGSRRASLYQQQPVIREFTLQKQESTISQKGERQFLSI
ncbi:MAG: RRXRR domain-containing protein [Solobacterium sp.]|nr:RRXRR domain-containing protein [Solobacterium sp.]